MVKSEVWAQFQDRIGRTLGTPEAARDAVTPRGPIRGSKRRSIGATGTTPPSKRSLAMKCKTCGGHDHARCTRTKCPKHAQYGQPTTVSVKHPPHFPAEGSKPVEVSGVATP
jgi:hypothetical protein